MKIKSINPANFQEIGEAEVSTEQEIKQKVALANQTKQEWKEVPLTEKIELLLKAQKVFKKNQREIASIITQEVGTPITECQEEVAWDWGYYDWFLTHAYEYLSPQITYKDDKSTHEIWYEPYGVVAAITPWNLPFDLFVWAVIPNLLAGNVVIHKASEECILSGKLFEEFMQESGLPKGVFQAVHGDGKQGKTLVEQEIDMIWFTGSYKVGHELYKLAADKFIKIILELGGSNPSIIFPDADIEQLLGSLLFKRFSFCGQTCDALKRLIVHESVVDEVIEKLSQHISQLTAGDPANPLTKMGPLVSQKQQLLLKSQVDDALANGAKIIAQGKVEAKNPGAYYPATLLGDIKPTMKIWREEVFGPVLPVVTFSSEAEAVALANDTSYGLGSQVFTLDKDRALRVARGIAAGNVDINGVGHFKPSSPFGGYKHSGLGREHGEHGFRELTQIKLVARPNF